MCEMSNEQKFQVDSNQFFRLGPKALIAAICSCCGLFAIFIVSGLCFHFSLLLAGVSLKWELIPWLPIVLAAFGWSLGLTVVGHFFRSYRLDENSVHSREGVVRYRHTVVPLNRIQHAEVVRGPFERMLNLATLVIHTAGPASYAVGVKYLDQNLANEMLRKIVPEEPEQDNGDSERE